MLLHLRTHCLEEVDVEVGWGLIFYLAIDFFHEFFEPGGEGLNFGEEVRVFDFDYLEFLFKLEVGFGEYLIVLPFNG